MADKNLTTRTSVPTSSDEKPVAPGMSRTILICEDDDGIRELLVEAVQGEGFAVHTAHNGREALELLSNGQEQYIVLLDLMMPGISGYEVLERMAADPQQLGEHIVIVVSATGFVRPISPSVIQKRLVRGFLKKPFELDELFALLYKLA